MKILSIIFAFAISGMVVSSEIKLIGEFQFALEQELVFVIFDDEPDEYPLKSLILIEPLTGVVDTLIKNSYFVSTFKKNNYEFLNTDGFSVFIYNAKNKKNNLIGEFGTKDKPIINVFEYLKTPHMFFWDGEANSIIFCKVINNKIEILEIFSISGLEYHGLFVHKFEEFVLIKIDGFLYLFDLKKSQLISKSEFLVKHLVVEDDIFLFATENGIYQGSLGSLLEKGFSRSYDFIIDINFKYSDNLILNLGKIYYINTLENRIYKVENNLILEQKDIELMTNDRFKVLLDSRFKLSVFVK